MPNLGTNTVQRNGTDHRATAAAMLFILKATAVFRPLSPATNHLADTSGNTGVSRSFSALNRCITKWVYRRSVLARLFGIYAASGAEPSGLTVADTAHAAAGAVAVAIVAANPRRCGSN
jgi:hypothetical protein